MAGTQMGKGSDISKGKLRSGLLGVGLASGLVAASLVGVGPANASCASAFGISIGTGCESEFFTFSVGLGQFATAESSGFGTGAVAIGEKSSASASGFFTAAGSCDCLAGGAEPSANSDGVATISWAGGQNSTSQTNGIANFAAAIGDREYAEAGLSPTDFLNAAINTGQADDAFDSEGLAKSQVRAGGGALNLAINVLGSADDGGITGPEPLDIEALGFFNSAINVVGNRNIVSAVGNFNNATNLGNVLQFPNGSDNIVRAGTSELPANLSAAFNYQGVFTDESCIASCGNIVNAGPGPLAVAAAIDVVIQTVNQTGPGITIRIPFNSTPNTTNVFATGNSVAPTTFATGTGNRPGSQPSGSLTNAGKQFRSSLDQISKRLNVSVQKALGGFGKKKQNSESETHS